nr:hypothetical protein [Holospora undulata]
MILEGPDGVDYLVKAGAVLADKCMMPIKRGGENSKKRGVRSLFLLKKPVLGLNYDRYLYFFKSRHLIENFFAKPKAVQNDCSAL